MRNPGIINFQPTEDGALEAVLHVFIEIRSLITYVLGR